MLLGKVVLISIDSVSDNDFDKLKKYPNFTKFVSGACVVRGVKSIFLSNTYPIHTSVMTGVMPFEHGIFSNTRVEPHEKNPHWNFYAKDIKVKPLWQLAKENGLKTAGFMWPVSAGAKGIDYNIPEIFAREGENQLIKSFKNGSTLLQIREFLRHGKELNTKDIISLDNFTTSCACDVLREKKPDFTFIHLISYDNAHHHNGKNSERCELAMQMIDKCLGRIMDTVDDDTAIIIFSDHGQLDVHTAITPNMLLLKMGHLSMAEDETISDYKAHFESLGGSSFFKNISLSATELDSVKAELEKCEWFNRFLTEEEMQVSGHGEYAFGICAKTGYHMLNSFQEEKGNHGYPLDYDNYDVIYGIYSKNVNAGTELSGGNLLNVSALIANELKINAPQIKGKIKREIYK